MGWNSILNRINWDKAINSQVFPLALWGASFLINMTAAWVMGFSSYEPSGDEGEYLQLAQNLADKYQFMGKERMLFRTPMYPGLLALIFKITGPAVAVAKLTNCLIGAFIPVGIFYLGKLLFNPRVAAVAGAVAVIQPTLLAPHITLYSESLSSAAFVWVNVYLVVLVKKVDMDRQGIVKFFWPQWLGLGTSLGLLVLIKPQHMIFLPLLLLGGIWHFRQIKFHLAYPVSLTLIGFCLLLCPWWIRNAIITRGHFVPFTTSGDRTLIDANNPTIAHMSPHFKKIDTSGRKIWLGPGKHLHDLKDNELVNSNEIKHMSEIEQAAYFRQKALAWIVAHPKDWLILVVKKLCYGLGVWPLWQGSLQLLVLSSSFLIILALSIPGWLIMIKNPGIPRLLLIHLVTFMVITIIFFGSWRYRHPYEGSFILAAVLGVSEIYKMCRKSS